MKVIWYTSLHSTDSEVEPLHVPLGVQIWSKHELVFLWATACEQIEWIDIVNIKSSAMAPQII